MRPGQTNVPDKGGERIMLAVLGPDAGQTPQQKRTLHCLFCKANLLYHSKANDFFLSKKR